MAPIFDGKNKNKLDHPLRRQILPPEGTIARFGIAEGEVIADVGCGVGYFTVPLAQAVGPQGRILAFDVQVDMIHETVKRVDECGLSQVEVLITEADFLPLSDAELDGIFLSMILHEVEDLAEYLTELQRVLKPGGRLMIIEWEKKVTAGGPPIEHRLAQAALRKFLQDSGWIKVQSLELNEAVYGMIAWREK